MQRTDGRMLDAVTEARRPASRRDLMHGSARLAGGGALAMLLVGRARLSVLAQDGTPEGGESPFESPVDVLNYALTLEHLEATFYAQGLDALGVQAFVDLGFQESVFDYLTEIRNNEAEHVDTLTAVIDQLGGEPVEAEAEYDFGEATEDATAFLATAQALENTGVGAYTGAAQYLIEEDELLTAALTIHGVEARHAAYLNLLNDADPFPAAFDEPLTPDEVLEIAAPFLGAEGETEDEGEAEDEGTPEA